MDRLDQLLTVANPLLTRVDDVLSTVGAPGGHDVWAELRRVRLLPGDAARAVAGLRPTAILDSVPELRADARAYADLADALPLPGEWSGAAADAYEQARRSTAERLHGGPDSLGERMEATADLADALTGWMLGARADLAESLAEVCLTTEALTLTGSAHPPGQEAGAAAAIGAILLRTVADSYDRAEDLLDDYVRLQNPLPV
ncbi:hypothetical protein [Actinoplanes derwentensis]|uniref:Uncharacterized protein n=1 Tax=Actinoplanes derwentensis TaxID=113562 RepID=A0A1H2CPI0_9ACTN|nr:hypothetical protein [Actinoplanes derwentensis]GID83889.1 hypothetical protein Ade03nite_28130 [Actinoplanes derwentensis]SDT72398.1 hypothetical protein SAMN04489716_6400 [Actinoplanes derwentensis]